MTRKKSGVDWSLTACCGRKPVRVAGIWRCPCGQEHHTMYDKYHDHSTVRAYDRHDHDYARGEDD